MTIKELFFDYKASFFAQKPYPTPSNNEVFLTSSIVYSSVTVVTFIHFFHHFVVGGPCDIVAGLCACLQHKQI